MVRAGSFALLKRLAASVLDKRRVSVQKAVVKQAVECRIDQACADLDADLLFQNANVMHGDIKPSNVFVDPAGRAAKLADFGIARAVGGTERSALVTRLIGTPRYMAPEQKTVGALVGPRTDLYLLSRTLADFIGATVRRGTDELRF